MAYDLTHYINLKQLKALGTKVKGSLDTLFSRTTGLELHNAGSHNAIYRGKNLGTEPTAAQYAAINAGTFEDIYPGDYWQKEITFEYPDYTNEDALTSKTMTVAMYVAELDYFKNSYNCPSNKHHALIVPNAPLFSCPYHDVLDSGYGYKKCKIWQVYLQGALNAFEAFFGAEHVLTYHVRIPINLTGDGNAQDEKTDLLNQFMCYGTNIKGYNFTWHANTQLALFKHRRGAMFMGSINEEYWLADMWQELDGTVTGNYVCVNGIHYLASGKTITGASGVKPFCIIGA